MTDNDKDTTTLYTVNQEKAEEYLKKADERIKRFENFSKKLKEIKERSTT